MSLSSHLTHMCLVECIPQPPRKLFSSIKNYYNSCSNDFTMESLLSPQELSYFNNSITPPRSCSIHASNRDGNLRSSIVKCSTAIDHHYSPRFAEFVDSPRALHTHVRGHTRVPAPLAVPNPFRFITDPRGEDLR